MKFTTIRIKKAMFLIFFSILTWWLFSNFKLVGKALDILLNVLSPFIIGFSIAFIFNKPMDFIERKLFTDFSLFESLKQKHKRMISFLITLLLFLILIGLFSIIVIPNLIEVSKELANQIPKYFDDFKNFLDTSSLGGIKISQQVQNLNLKDVHDSATTFVKGGLLNWVGSTFGAFSSVFGAITSLLLGFVFSIYFLLQKEELMYNIKKLTVAVLPHKEAERLVHITHITNDSFSNFITGQTIEVFVIGIIFFISMFILNFPHALMISVIIAISAFVPIVGSFIGLLIGCLLIFAEDPQRTIYFILLFFIIQQIEGNLIYPKVVGKASGLSSVWILAAVTVGGSLFGILGIILFVPLFSVVQKLLQEYLERKSMEKDLDHLNLASNDDQR